MTETQIRAKVVETAEGYLGYKESDGSHKKIIDLYNSHKPLARGYAVKYTDEWCATFVSAVAIACRMTDVMPTECSCSKMIELYRARGRWKEEDSYRPSPGDLILYDWEDSGKGDNLGYPNHVGMVAKVNGTSLLILEGNRSSAVGYRTMAVDGKYIRGYCLPDYASKATEAEPVKRPSAPSSDLQALKPYMVMITASMLNYRAGPGTSCKINGVVKKGEIYTIVAEQLVGNTKWGKLKSGAGWISLKYAAKL